MHPAVFAAYGYSAVLGRGYLPETCKEAILNLALDALDNVAEAVFTGARYYAAQEPTFYWVLLQMSLQEAFVVRGEWPNEFAPYWDQAEADRKQSLLDLAATSLRDGKEIGFPTVPAPWIFTGARSTRGMGTNGYSESEVVPDSHALLSNLKHLRVDVIAADTRKLDALLKFAIGLLDWTLQTITPPFSSPKDRYETRLPHEWIGGYGEWLGKFCAALPSDTVIAEILTRIIGAEAFAAFSVAEPFMQGFMLEAITSRQSVLPGHEKIWTQLSLWLLDRHVSEIGRRRSHIEREYQGCAALALFCFPGGGFCAAEEDWQGLQQFLPTITRAIPEFGLDPILCLAVTRFLKKAGQQLLPNPALQWMHQIAEAKKSDLQFWQAHGQSFAEIVKKVVETHLKSLGSEQRTMIAKISDILIDNGIRGAGAIQQELAKA